MLRRQDGQILPGLVVLLGVTLGLGMLFLQVGKASLFRAEAQNAADAAALAGAKEIRRQLQVQYATMGYTSAAAIDQGAVIAQMRAYAGRNDGELVGQELNLAAADVKAWTRTASALGEDASRAEREDFRGTARARANVGFGIAPSFGGQVSPGVGGAIPAPATGATPRISADEWDQLKRQLTGKPPGCPDVVTLGLFLKAQGLMVWQNDHPQLGGDAGHAYNPSSWHLECNRMGALDVNFGGPGNLIPAETAAIDPLIGPLADLGFHTIWRDGGMHDNHLHVDVSGSPGVGGAGGLGGFTGPLDDALLDIRLVDWETPVESLLPSGGSYPTTSSLAGPPDPQIMALMCRMASPHGPKILLATFGTAIVESGIHNLNHGMDESHGVMQQQWTQGWGTLADTMDPPKAIRMFLDAAIRVDRQYPGLSAGQLAAIVQRPREDLRGRYQEEKATAERLIARACR